VRLLRESGWLAETDQVIVLNTGTGLKYPHTMPPGEPALAHGPPRRRMRTDRRAG
jgi:threonine synthase